MIQVTAKHLKFHGQASALLNKLMRFIRVVGIVIWKFLDFFKTTMRLFRAFVFHAGQKEDHFCMPIFDNMPLFGHTKHSNILAQ